MNILSTLIEYLTKDSSIKDIIPFKSLSHENEYFIFTIPHFQLRMSPSVFLLTKDIPKPVLNHLQLDPKNILLSIKCFNPELSEIFILTQDKIYHTDMDLGLDPDLKDFSEISFDQEETDYDLFAQLKEMLSDLKIRILD